MNDNLKATISQFMDTIDSSYLMEFAREYRMIGDNERWGGKHAGSAAELAGADRIYEELKALGLQNVEKVPIKCTKFQFNDASITVEGDPSGTVLYPFGLTSPGTGPEGLTAEIVDAGTSKKEFYEENDVTGKIVLVEAMGVLEGASPSAQIMQAELRGAVAVLQFATEDLLNDETIRVQAMNHVPKIPIVGISLKDASFLRQCLKDGLTKVHLNHDAEYDVDQGISHTVVAEIPGQTDERIFFSGHLDHYFRCMQDNISSVCTLLGTAKAMLDMGYKPYRTITFIFNSSHEAGLSDTRYPYISGSYRLLTEAKPEWIPKAIADLNFEYSALELDYFTGFGSYELNKTFDEYMSAFPTQIDGFPKGVIPARRDCYLFLSWADTISYISNGIPTFMNDSLHEQIYELTSPYIGRDHSNHDDMDVFSEKGLSAWTRYFGGFGIFMDNKPVAPYEFTERTEAFAFTDEEKATLARNEISTESYDEAYADYCAAAGELSAAIGTYNGNNASEDGVRCAVNELLHNMYKEMIDDFDKISPQDALVTEHEKHLIDMQLLEGAAQALDACNPQSALEEYLLGIDVAAWSKHFDKEIVDFARDRIYGEEYAHRRLWARGRELSCLTMYEAISGIEKKMAAGETDYADEIAEVRRAWQSEKDLLLECLVRDEAAMRRLAGEMRSIAGMLQ